MLSVVMNPAAMVTNLGDLRKGGILIANEDGFNDKEFKLAKVDANPLEASVIQDSYRIIKVPMTQLTRDAVAEFGLGVKIADRCKNFFAMGLVYWLFGRSLDPTLRFIRDKFGKKPDVAAANEAALRAGWAFGETTEAFGESYQVTAAELPARHLSQHHGEPGAGLGVDCGIEAKRQGPVLRDLSDHASQRHPARADQVQEFRGQDLSG